MHVRPGLNIFDDKGNELEWDYEHDTRFFVNSDDDSDDLQATKKVKLSEEKPKEATVIVDTLHGEIRSKGRGSKRFLSIIKDSEGGPNKDSNTMRPTLSSDTV